MKKLVDGRYWLWRHYQHMTLLTKIDGSIEFTAFADLDEGGSQICCPL